jgi:hypothetical protein
MRPIPSGIAHSPMMRRGRMLSDQISPREYCWKLRGK